MSARMRTISRIVIIFLLCFQNFEGAIALSYGVSPPFLWGSDCLGLTSAALATAVSRTIDIGLNLFCDKQERARQAGVRGVIS
jgi:hypothetical protein